MRPFVATIFGRATLRSPILRWTFYWDRAGDCGGVSRGTDPFTWPILVRQFSRLENGPNKRPPCSSVAYQPSLTARKPDWHSLM